MTFPLGAALLLVGSLAPPAAAQADTDPRATLRAHHIELVPSAHWTQDDVAALADALSSLPGKLAQFPGGPLQLARELAPAEFGIVRWEEGTRRLVLGEVHAPAEDRRAQSRLGRLTAAEKRTLWRRRALVHAVMQRWDDALGISKRPAWRRISGWLTPFERPLTWKEEALSSWSFAYSRRLGETSASLDLVTFAEEALAPVEALREDALPADEQVRCQEFSRWRALFGALFEAGVVDAEEPRAARGACPAFDAFLDRGSLSHAEVLYVAASGRAPESLFGHLLLRLQRKRGEWVRGPGFETAIQLVALTGSGEPDLRYVVRGVFGGFRMTVMTGPLTELLHQATENEGRSIRRFRLKLSDAQLERLVERTWELERRGYQDYWFFSDNCATLAAFLVEGVLGEEVRVDLPPRWSPVLPAAVLDALTKAGVLEPLPGAFESVRDRAERSLAQREGALRSLQAGLPPADGQTLLRLHEALSSPRLRDRRHGWARLSEQTASWGAPGVHHPTVRAALYVYWLHTVRIERYAVERARAARMKVELGTLLPGEVHLPDADESVASRQRLYEREAADERQMAALDRLALAEYLLERAPRRPLAPAEQAVVADARALADGFRELTLRHGDVVAAHFSHVDASAYLAQEAQVRAEAESRWFRRAVRESGYAKLAVGGAMTPGGEGLVVLSTAALHEGLGDQRVHGFRATSEMRVASGTVFLRPRWGLPEVVHSDLTLWSYRTVQQEVAPFRASLQDGLGWGFRVGFDSDGARALRSRLIATVEGLGLLHASPTLHRFGALGVGATVQARFGSQGTWTLPDRAVFGAGPQLNLLHRLPLGEDLADALRLEASWRPSWEVGLRGVRHELAGALTLDVRVKVSTRGFLLRPGLGATWERPQEGRAWHSARAFLLVERLRLQP